MFPIKDDAPAGKFPFINLALIGVTIYVFFQELAAPDLDLFLTEWALIPSQVDFLNPSSLFPFFTSIFLHAGWLHIISNLWFLWIFGDNVEARLGHFNYLSFYVLSGILANFIQYLVIPDSLLPMLGASGAVAGVLGAYFIFFPGHRVHTLIPIFFFPLFVEIPAGVMLFYWFFTQLFAGLTSLDAAVMTGGVAWWAHIGGFFFGIITAKVLEK